MIDKVHFVSEMKKALELPDSYCVDTTEQKIVIPTDDFLSHDGFDLELGFQVFHFNVRKSPSLLNTITNNLSLQNVVSLNEIIAVLKAENGRFNGLRSILESGASSSKLCRYYSAVDYWGGRDGTRNLEKAVNLLIKTPWGGYDEKLRWIDDPQKKGIAAKICLDASTPQFNWNYGGNINCITNYSKATSFLNLLLESKGYSPSYTSINDYAVYLYENKKYKEAFTFFNYAEKFGDNHPELKWALGVCWLCGFNHGSTWVNPLVISDYSRLMAIKYFEQCGDANIYNYAHYAYLSFLYWDRNPKASGDKIIKGVDPAKVAENDKHGAEKGFAISLFRYGMSKLSGCKEWKDKNSPIFKANEKLYREALDTINRSLTGKYPYWLDQKQFRDCINAEIKKCKDGLELMYLYYSEANNWMFQKTPSKWTTSDNLHFSYKDYLEDRKKNQEERKKKGFWGKLFD